MASKHQPDAMASSAVPLMADVENGQEDFDATDSIKNDFAYNNNVAGAAKHIRMGMKCKGVVVHVSQSFHLPKGSYVRCTAC